MIIALIVLAVVVLAAGFYFIKRTQPQLEKGARRMAHVLHQHPADSPGYTKLYLRKPVGQTQASAAVVAKGPQTDPAGNPLEHTIHLHGQREVDVPTGSKVTFPDGTTVEIG